MSQPAVEQAAIDRRSDTEKEYGVYVATEAINFGTARAFNVGDPVPTSHVERGLVTASGDGQNVAKRDTKAGRQALGLPDEKKG